MLRGEPYRLKALIAGNNPMSQWPKQEATREAFKGLDLLVHIDLFQNETSNPQVVFDEIGKVFWHNRVSAPFRSLIVLSPYY